MLRWSIVGLFWTFTLYAFVARSILQKRRTRDAGIRGVARDRGLAARVAGLLIVPAWLVIGLAPLGFRQSVPRALETAGLCCTVAGMALAVSSQRVMGASWRIGVQPGERTRLVREGPFRSVRNPFFTGMSLVAIGMTLATPSMVGTAATLCLLLVLTIQVRLVEEPHLLDTFGDEYRAYAREAGRFVPRIGRFRA